LDIESIEGVPLSSLLVQHQIGLIVFLSVLLLIALSNLRALRRLGNYQSPAAFPRVSVLVPARNEKANIGSCVRSLLAQQYPDFQVLVLDDNSSDETWQVLQALATEDSRLRVLKGKPLPREWLGKNWACHQLAQAADGELLLFTDADTRHHPYALRDAVAALLAEKADLVTALPQEKVVSWAEKLIVPVLLWSIISFVPLRLAYKVRTPLLSATIGQFMLFSRQAYEQIGGHAAVKQNVLDDLMLGRRIKAHGLRWRLLDGSERISCRMYENSHQVYEGLSKNLFAVFQYNVPVFVFIWLWLGVVFLEPLLLLLLGTTAAPLSGLSLGLAAAAVALSLLSWGITHWRFGFPLYLVFFYPITMLLAVAIAMSSMVLTLRGRATWKGRTLARQAIRWW
jgi:chlorobactene glucosyltransferase